MSPEKQRLLLFTIATFFFILGFIANVVLYSPVYSLNQKIVIYLQNQITNTAFRGFMNLISNIFNPVVCAGYILILYLMTARKLEVIAFLLWFLFLSWAISVLKQIFQQPRPYWVNSQVQMLEWTCYTEYGSPSGHSALVIILLDFLVRFGCRWSQKFKRMQLFWYILVFIGQITVMFSRIYLGMHSLNQVLFGFMIGSYSLVPYYLFVQKFLFFFCIKFLSQGRKVSNFVIMLVLSLALGIQQVLMTFIPVYHPYDEPTNPWIQAITSRTACHSYKYSTSFYLRCFQDQAIGFGIPALMISLSATHNGYSLLKKFAYPRFSWKFLAYLLTTIIIAMIPVAIFLNPQWKKLNVRFQAVLLWVLNSLGFIFGIIALVAVSPYLLRLFRLDDYTFQNYYNQYKITTIEEGTGQKQVQMMNIELPQVSDNDMNNL